MANHGPNEGHTPACPRSEELAGYRPASHLGGGKVRASSLEVTAGSKAFHEEHVQGKQTTQGSGLQFKHGSLPRWPKWDMGNQDTLLLATSLLYILKATVVEEY